ncbi:MAG: hypothetical protein M3Y69_03505 [Verrucomicrobiota bacterium]|nr:hypothetical protein [Verrucomicrobiota bacterium]
MKKTILCALAAGALVSSSATVRAHDDDYDGVTQVDRYRDADVIHYDHHHRQVYTDEYGRVIGEQTVHHDHHYVQPRYNRYRHHHRSAISLFFGGF